MTLEQLFELRVDELVHKYQGKTLIFLKGFDLPQIKYLMSREDSLLNAPELITDDGYLDLERLNDKWMDCLTEIQMSIRPLIGFYEELTAIRDFLPRIKAERIVVLENNLLSPWVPSCFSPALGLRLFDYWQEEHEPQDQEIQWLSRFYGDVKLLDSEHVLLLPTDMDDPQIEYLPFWPQETEFEEPDGSEERIEAGSIKDWSYCASLLRGDNAPSVFLHSGEELSPRHMALLYIAKAMGLPLAFDELELYREKYVYDDKQFIPLLQKYWGGNAAFRKLLFYKDPDRSKETEELTQGQIIAEIVDQCERAIDGDSFSNLFITAPTGSGKSILFQIPALYLADKYDLVTIVVSPLIALMNDQVDQLQRERGISIAACINSTMTMEERMAAIQEIHTGKKSLIYLAPELLLTTQLQAFLGGRRVGMVVIDEAHTVTSWGRDFRSDYWFLGDFLKKTKRDGLIFPVLCLTATAVYSGQDDVVNDTINELGLENTIIHLGNVKRENIAFDIRLHSRDEVEGRLETAKMDLILDEVRRYTGHKEKTLAYFPYRTQVDDIYNMVHVSEHIRLRRYHSRVPDEERKLTEKSYKMGEALGLLCTKAFGMGVDVGDIKHVIHFAPTGSLSDYVQEIGRAARNTNIQGVAHIDFFPGDLRYVRTLNSISEMRQYQLREMLKKLCAIYTLKKRRNLLISAETFGYLFRENELENRTKSGLMLLAKDLSYKYSFPVLIVRPRAMLSKNYVHVPAPLEREFQKQYGSFAKLQKGTDRRVLNTYGQSHAVEVFSSGNTYLVDMALLWEKCYPDMAFGMFKKNFFEREYQVGAEKYHFAPRAKVEVHYKDEYDIVSQKLEHVLSVIQEIFHRHKNGDVKKFTLLEFEHELNEALGEKLLPHDKVSLILDVFTEGAGENAAYVPSYNQVRVLRKRRQPGEDESVYFVSSVAYSRMSNYFIRQMEQCAPNEDGNTFHRFYPMTQNKSIEIMPTLRLLELMNLANYEVRGGEKAEVFIRINDPAKLNRLANGNYTNSVLQAIQERHRNNDKLLSAFFTSTMTTEQRWELIEQYFLGNDDFVREKLHIEG